MTAGTDADLSALLRHIDATLPQPGPGWPGNWPQEIEVALLNAVLSIRATYGPADPWVTSSTQRYRDHRYPGRPDDLLVLAGQNPAQLADLIGDREILPHLLKTTAVVQAAQKLLHVGVRHAGDLDPTSWAHRHAFCAVHSLGRLSWQSLLTLLGHPADTAELWTQRFLTEALSRPATSTETRALLDQAAAHLAVPATELEHTIRVHLSRRA